MKNARSRPMQDAGSNGGKATDYESRGREVSRGQYALFLRAAPPSASWREVADAIRDGEIPDHWQGGEDA